MYSFEEKDKVVSSISMPTVLLAPIRTDIVQFVHTSMAKNKRQAYAVSRAAGHQTSAESWGTGRAVARIPRVKGGGTHRSGQAAYGNMCRSGRMFAPTRIWRRWHRPINQNQRRYATASALAATALASLVLARGHKVERIAEVPLVLSAGIESIKKTKDAIAVLKRVDAFADVQRVMDSRKMRAGKGKLRNRRFTQRRGPLVIYNKDDGIVKAFRNVPGIDMCCVTRLNLLQLAPGGHLGRFCIWTEDAFKALDGLYGTYRKASELKKGFSLPRAVMGNADLHRLINSDEVQSAIRPSKEIERKHAMTKRNPLKNLNAMLRLNPYIKQARKIANDKRDSQRDAALKKKRAIHAKFGKVFHSQLKA